LTEKAILSMATEFSAVWAYNPFMREIYAIMSRLLFQWDFIGSLTTKQTA